MPNATIIKTSLANPTQATLASFISTSLETAGFTQVDTYATTSEHRIMRLAMSSAVRGALFLQVVLVSNSLNVTIGTNWNTTTKAMTNNASVSSGGGFITGTTTVFATSVSHPEFRGILLEQGTAQRIIGVVRPGNSPPSWWDEDSFPYGFAINHSSSLAANNCIGCTTPFGNNLTFSFLTSSVIQDGISIASNIRSILPLIILNNGTSGVIGACTDVVICASNTLRNLDTITVSDSEIYTYFWGNLTACGLAIRST